MNSTITVASPYDAVGTYAQSSTNTWTLTIKNHCANSTKVTHVYSDAALVDYNYTLTTPAENWLPFTTFYSKTGDSSDLCGNVTLRAEYDGADLVGGEPITF